MEGTKFLREFMNLPNSQMLADATINCDGKQWKVHRVVLACHGEFFQKCWEGSFKEAETHELNIGDEDSETVQRLVDYAYIFDYDDAPTHGSAYSNVLETNTAIYSLADRFKCADLAAHAIKKFRRAAGSVLHFTVPPLDAIRMVYTTTPESERGLRNICVKMWANMETLMQAAENTADVYNLCHLKEANDLYWDTCLLAPADWKTVSNIFRSTKTKEHEVVLEIIQGEYREGTPYHAICDLEDTIVTPVAVMLHAVIAKICSKVAKWGGDKHDLVFRIVRSLEP